MIFTLPHLVHAALVLAGHSAFAQRGIFLLNMEQTAALMLRSLQYMKQQIPVPMLPAPIQIILPVPAPALLLHITESRL